MSTRKTTAEKLASIRAEIAQLKNEEKQLLQQHKKDVEKARTKRLIERGAILESLIEGAAELTNDQIATILKRTVGSDYGVKIVNQIKSLKPEKPVTAPQGETPARNDEAAANQIEITENGGKFSAHGAENADTKGS